MQERYRNFPPLTHTSVHIKNKTQTKINHTTKKKHNTPLPYTSPNKKKPTKSAISTFVKKYVNTLSILSVV